MKRKIRTVLDFLNIDGYAVITPKVAIDFISWLDEEDLDEEVREDLRGMITSLEQYKGDKVRLEWAEQAPSGLSWVGVEE
jgi:hypothetical protein